MMEPGLRHILTGLREITTRKNPFTPILLEVPATQEHAGRFLTFFNIVSKSMTIVDLMQMDTTNTSVLLVTTIHGTPMKMTCRTWSRSTLLSHLFR